MIVYKDIISGDELFTDAHNAKLVNDFFYEVDGKLITESTSVDVNIGANPSAEEEAEQLDQGEAKKVINIVSEMRFSETGFGTKKEYTTYLKSYVKALKAKLAEESESKADEFAEKAKTHVMELLKNFKDYQFFMGESNDPDAHIALLNYREDGTTPYFIFFKDGLLAEKF